MPGFQLERPVNAPAKSCNFDRRISNSGLGSIAVSLASPEIDSKGRVRQMRPVVLY